MLMTGVTGFVGKVLLEKFLREVPRIGKIYLLIRNKPKFTLQQRMMKEIFGAKILHPNARKSGQIGFRDKIA